MTTVKQIINNLFPNKKITYRLSDLLDQLRDDDSKSEYIYIAIEKINRSREFSYLTINELTTIYHHCPPLQRNLYEVIFPKKIVKTYIDFEYYTNYNLDIQNHCIPPATCLKIFYFILNPLNHTQNQNEDYIPTALEQFLLLEATTTEKISYHFIHANPSILFENNITLGLFIKTFLHLLLSSIIQHKCSIFNINFNLEKSTIQDLITVLSPHINNLRIHCVKCYLAINNMNISEIAQLLVLNKEKQYTLAIDLNIYNRNQQFRLFDSVKKGKTNIFIPSINFPYNNLSKSSYEELLKNSIITYKNENSNLPIICFENNQFKIKLLNTNNLYLSPDYNTKILNNINEHFKFFSTLHTTTKIMPEPNQLNTSPTNPYNFTNLSQQEIHNFIPFVEKLIKNDINHQGYIRSCVRGNVNQSLLFFNIGGNYRFCPAKAAHHKHNTVAILINTKKFTFAIRCKDAQCNNRILSWNKLQ